MKHINILQVEDDQDDIELMEHAFTDNGIFAELTTVKQGDCVIPYLENCTVYPDVILLDLNLPKMHGKEILKQLKSLQTFRDIPVIILTTSTSAEDMEYCLQMGADKYISKPATVEGFNSVVTAIVTIATQNILNYSDKKV